ncbi:MAG: CcoQ/FixQ family Cbb3-type cytochrome c oxidase assembly chaperone [Gammaproteobacteria bacterium]
MESSSSEVFWQSAWTVFAFVFFVAVVFWAWSGKRKKSFDEAARMALDDDKDVPDDGRRDP